MTIRIKKEFSPVTITLDTPCDVALLQQIVNKAIRGETHTYRLFRSPSSSANIEWMDLARRILEL